MCEDDLKDLLRRWPFQTGQINARLITGRDGSAKIQVRVELGLLQMETTGRPDGQQPHGYQTWLFYHTHCLRRHIEAAGTETGFSLDSEACRELRREAVQFHHRFVALFALEHYEAVIRDTTHFLHVVDLCRRYGQSEYDRVALNQYRPSVMAMRVRAEVAMAMAENRRDDARRVIDHGLNQLRAFYDQTGQAEQFDKSNEVHMLHGLRDALVPKLPASQRVELEERLRQALASENYELAAILRDELRLL
jgi:hypothetical protein